ncbi:hypothetical protein P170DRAFT_439017 [Aspergillus steynii IBT 23096]|uniref:Tse2 ADP-ribosyltransferase toxin domain-containing protein n=1 Tax=Aspergillus steynii IBT 23096 TaxID=1392250 RepID=A0A2I2G368_9EURO|nr:uncharacterized protein P170DRAFT_439017 [Aspergillus steynii IBT 23096]PLB47326.1 hypothetical protein P170DRAFT_439017 [Aspergillus steynii IBT 23096]
MFKRIIHRPAVRGNNILKNRCNFSLVSVHSTFPATLYRLQFKRESQLYDKKQQQGDSEVDDAVNVSQDGLIYPEVSESISNGALFMPNTFFMQELTRMSFDYYLDNLADSQPSADPHLLCIPKDTPIPRTLILLRERNIRSRFSLQPSFPMSLNDLNSALTDFYAKYGTPTPAEKWLVEHEYHKSSDDSKEDWMQY